SSLPSEPKFPCPSISGSRIEMAVPAAAAGADPAAAADRLPALAGGHVERLRPAGAGDHDRPDAHRPGAAVHPHRGAALTATGAG
ncbi:hypothetical protein, partial [Kitasatospora sp. NPDC047058]|uniref:hypothetical protein n=1 Tax=Kitasatospora sp. NPDC047058 TaxID=3155620 RepID=UPI0033FF922C